MLERTQDKAADIAGLMQDIGTRARAAARTLATVPSRQKDDALRAMAARVRSAREAILAANAMDLETMRAGGQTAAYLDRGTLTDERIEAKIDR